MAIDIEFEYEPSDPDEWEDYDPERDDEPENDGFEEYESYDSYLERWAYRDKDEDDFN